MSSDCFSLEDSGGQHDWEVFSGAQCLLQVGLIHEVGESAVSRWRERREIQNVHYVTDTLKIGSTASEAFGYGFDLTNDANFRSNNVLGTTLAGLWPVHW